MPTLGSTISDTRSGCVVLIWSMIEEVFCVTRVGSVINCKTVFPVESGPVQIATRIIRGKRYIKVSENE